MQTVNTFTDENLKSIYGFLIWADGISQAEMLAFLFGPPANPRNSQSVFLVIVHDNEKSEKKILFKCNTGRNGYSSLTYEKSRKITGNAKMGNHEEN